MNESDPGPKDPLTPYALTKVRGYELDDGKIRVALRAAALTGCWFTMAYTREERILYGFVNFLLYLKREKVTPGTFMFCSCNDFAGRCVYFTSAAPGWQGLIHEPCGGIASMESIQ